jgi:DNA-binding CsgD family transcriptional regulator
LSFVGREREFAALSSALTAAKSARGQMALLYGDPGIGKSALMRELAACAEAEGFRPLWGRCLEEPGTPIYWPWLQIGRAWLLPQEEQDRNTILGPDLDILADLFPDLAPHSLKRNRQIALEDANQARFRLFDAYARFWRRAARHEPLLLLLDDLHQDSSASIKLLEFVAEAAQDCSLFFVAAFRDKEIAPDHPVNALLSRVAGRPSVQRHRLIGLGEDATQALLALLTAADLSPAIRATVYRESEGNPLFIQELAREIDRTYTANPALLDTGSTLPLPEGIRALIGERINRLSATCRSVLDVAAVLGRAFDHSLLVSLCGGDKIAADEALDEAFRARVIEESPQRGNYQFTHALVRETLYDALSPPRRIRLHRAIGELIERSYTNDLDQFLPLLAHHFTQAAGEANEKALEYLQRAGRRADAFYAHSEAIHYYQEALHLPHVLAGTRTELLLALGWAQIHGGSLDAAAATFLRTAAAARDQSRDDFLASAVLGFEDARWRGGKQGGESVDLLMKTLGSIKAIDPKQQVRLYAALCRASSYASRKQQALDAFDKAVSLARRIGDPQALVVALCAIASAQTWPELLPLRLDAAKEAIELANRCGQTNWPVSLMTGFFFEDLIESGDIETARAITEMHIRVADSMRDPFLRAVGQNMRVVLTMQENVGQRAEEAIRQAFLTGRRFSLSKAEGVFGLQMFTLRREQGRLEELRPVLEEFLNAGQKSAWLPGLAVTCAELGLTEKAREFYRHLIANSFATVPRDGMWLVSLAYIAETCVHLQDLEHASLIYQQLTPYSRRNLPVSVSLCLGCADRYLAMLANLMGNWPLVEHHFQVALAFDERCGNVVWLANTRFRYAEAILENGGEMALAADLLEQARSTAIELGMAAMQKRCENLRERMVSTVIDGDGLTRRELQIMDLLATGKSNRKIGERLFISPHTVANHVRHILEKTGMPNRTAVATYTLERKRGKR